MIIQQSGVPASLSNKGMLPHNLESGSDSALSRSFRLGIARRLNRMKLLKLKG